MTTIDNLIKKIKRLTQNNDHNESVLVLAQFLDDKAAIEKMISITNATTKAGYTSYELIGERREILKGLLNTVIFQYGEDVKKRIYSVF